MKSTSPTRLRVGVLALALTAALTPVAGASEGRASAARSTSTGSRGLARGAAADMGLAFVPNQGQLGSNVLYSAQADGFGVQFTQDEARLMFFEEEQGHLLDLRFIGANPDAAVIGRASAPAKVNYLTGDDPAEWATGLPTFGEVVYLDLWPGIDMMFRGDAGALKYEFLLHPGATPDAIRLAYDGTEGLSLDPSGSLRIATSLGSVKDARPIAYQRVGGRQVEVGARYVLLGSSRYGFGLDHYAAGRPLVLDPGIEYTTVLPGGTGYGIAVDAAGSTYVTGYTASSNFPTTPGSFDTGPPLSFDAFITKLDPAGEIAYSTFLGGSTGDEFGNGIEVDSAGNAYVTGSTDSLDFPTTLGAFAPALSGDTDAFVTKLSAAGSGLMYSTYLGGANRGFTGFDDDDTGNAIAIDAVGSAYVTGLTDSLDFPTTSGAFDTGLDGGQEAFVTKLDPTGSTLAYSTFLGGTKFGVVFNDTGTGIAVDAAGSAYVTGFTDSPDFPTTPGAFGTSFDGGLAAFVTKFDPFGAELQYSTFLGTDFDAATGIAVDASGAAFVSGYTGSPTFPTTPGAFDTTFSGDRDGFLSKLSPSGSDLIYSTYLGGNEVDYAHAVTFDTSGNAYMTGYTYSTDFPTTPGAFDTTLDGTTDTFVTKVNAAGSELVYSTYLGGPPSEIGNGIAVDTADDAYVTGSGGFVTKLSMPDELPNEPPTARLTVSCTGTDCQFDGSGSSDPDGLITSYSWSFGDGSASQSGPIVHHRFPEGAASYLVTLSVTDNQGAADSVMRTVTCTKKNPSKNKPTTCA